ncbi:hypothetical protein Fraau_1521 [Frateuria aurantia DSM 6220]|uniref:Uncharacterized protein n=1 Tax=Frateuria aurantia (strain ATCC 33424 / DSM 6220 / KCTC 2777 / LMG 1558 / NBRC 3245 / NCIMB 13370) TaxID=767434 RepID=H8L6F1_FRAAD|nr:hypothetical protein Fraau_1521 [Frateuria aurantia DSM 6220]
MVDAIYIVQGFGPGPESLPLTVPAYFDSAPAARRHACLLGTFCSEVTMRRHGDASRSAGVPDDAQEKARMGDSGF